MNIESKEIEIVPIGSLMLNPKNRNRHPREQIERLKKLIQKLGMRQPINVSNRSGFIWAGEGRYLAAKELGFTQVPIVRHDFESDEDEYAAGVSDNAIGAWAELDLAGINTDIGDLGPDFDLELLGLKDFTVDVSERYDEETEDQIPEAPKIPRVKMGDMFLLGTHRLLCGDSTDAEQVARLMNGEKADMVFTDPPYGISLDVNYLQRYQHKARDYVNKIEGDDGIDAGIDLKKIIEFSEASKECFIFGADNYPDCLPRGGSWVVWDKSVPSIDGIASDFELCWSRERHHYAMCRKLWKLAKAREETGQEGSHRTRWGHPTQKSIEMVLFFFERWGKKTTSVLDFFMGSGTTLIACEKTNRKCYGMEIDPIYCQVILDRWQKYTGQEPKREDGTPWSYIRDGGD